MDCLHGGHIEAALPVVNTLLLAENGMDQMGDGPVSAEGNERLPVDARRILFTCRTLSLLPSPAALLTFEFDEDFDKRLPAGSGIALASYAVVGAAAPAKLHELYMERVSLSSWRGCWPSKGPVCRRRCRRCRRRCRRCFGMARLPALTPLSFPCPSMLTDRAVPRAHQAL